MHRHSLCALFSAAIILTAAGETRALGSRSLLGVPGGAGLSTFGWASSGVGDMNGDGYLDVAASSRSSGKVLVFFGGPAMDPIPDLTLTGTPSDFGGTIAPAGDINGDGYDDLLVGRYSTGAGSVDVFFGALNPSTTPGLTASGTTSGDQFGAAIAGIGDMNGDGFDDFLVGAPRSDVPGSDAGQAFVFLGGPAPNNVPDLTLNGAAAFDNFGQSVAGPGDVNRDGFADVLVGAPMNDFTAANAGRAYLFLGGATLDFTADQFYNGAAAQDQLGGAVAGAGDVNADLFADLFIGAVNANSFFGRAYVYYGGASPDGIVDRTFSGLTSSTSYGFTVAGGDVNLDGLSDLIVGAPSDNSGGSLAGRIFIYLGGPSADTIADLAIIGEAGSSLGWSLAFAGDMNGDGFGDIIAGAPFATAGGASGRAVLHSIFRYNVVTPNGGERWVVGKPATVRWEGNDRADVAVSSDGGVSWSTLAWSVGGDDLNTITVPAPGPATNSARVRVTVAGQSPSGRDSDLGNGAFRIIEAVTPPAIASRLLASGGGAGGEALGTVVRAAGDVNGDGGPDFLVTAPSNSVVGTYAGRAYLQFGGAAFDGAVDLTLSGATAFDSFGQAADGVGDVNGDGFDDWIIGALYNDAAGPDAGRAYLYLGSASPDATADATMSGEAAGDVLGWSTAGAGDVNGDGYDDWIVGAPLNNGGGSAAGRAYLYFGGGSPDGALDRAFTGAAGDQLGYSVAGLGDVNGDGFDDVIAGAPVNAGGRAYVYFGRPSPDNIADLVLQGATAGDAFGSSVAPAGDVNGDGFADILVGAYLLDAFGVTNGGCAYVYFGGPSPDQVADLVLPGTVANEQCGTYLAGLGDVNDDGFDDIAVGSPFYSAGGSTNNGRVRVFLGGAVPDAAADLTIIGGGQSWTGPAAGVGDIRGDGFGDLLVGAQNQGFGLGAYTLFNLNRHHVLAPAGGETWNVGARKTVSWSGAEPADVWLSVDGGLTFEPLARDVGGEESNSIQLRVPHLPSKFARVRVIPSDASVSGGAMSDSSFTIQSTVSLLAFRTGEPPAGSRGVTVSWSTDPGPEELEGYRLERAHGDAWQTVVALTRETSVIDEAGSASHAYRLHAVNGLGEELMLGETTAAPLAPLRAWPLPYRGGDLSITFATASIAGAPVESVVGLYDASGRLVRELARGRYAPGQASAAWDGRDATGRAVAPGVYFLRVSTGGFTSSLKLTIVR